MKEEKIIITKSQLKRLVEKSRSRVTKAQPISQDDAHDMIDKLTSRHEAEYLSMIKKFQQEGVEGIAINKIAAWVRSYIKGD